MDVLNHAINHAAAKERRLKRKRDAEGQKSLFERSKKMSSGAMASAAMFKLDINVRDHVINHANTKAAVVADKEDRKRRRVMKLHNDVADIRKKTDDRWTVAELRTMCTYKKGTDKVPAPGTKKEDLKLFYEAHKTNPSPVKPTVDQQAMPPLTGLEEEEVVDEIEEELETGII